MVQGVRKSGKPKFMVDHNVGKLAKWLRLMGYDARFFNDGEDSRMIAAALAEDRIILTKDTHILKRGVVTSGRLKAILIEGDKSKEQICQVIQTMNIAHGFRPFTICIECNQPLLNRTKDEVKDRVPPYVFKTQEQYMECPECCRIYWKGTHWMAMTEKLRQIIAPR